MKPSILVLLCLAACTPVHPRVSLEPGTSLKAYRVFLVAPVTDDTRAPFDLDVVDSLQQEIADRLRSHQLTVVAKVPEDSSAATLVITSRLVNFKGMSNTLQLPFSGITRCELRSVLYDGQSGRRVGEIVASDLEEGSRPMTVLNECAHDVADAIHERLRH